jgi:hypothetical protein
MGLFAQRCWLEQGRGHARRLHENVSGGALLERAGALLDAAKPAPYGEICVTVSDDAARTVVLPWQAELRTASERSAYALACFERTGVVLDAGWVIRAEYRQFGGPGLAYALPATLVEGLAAMATQRRLRLASILPVTGATYFTVARPAKRAERIVLLMEQQRISVLRYTSVGMVAYDAEPVIGAVEDTLRRLLRRAAPELGAVAQVAVWSPSEDPRLVQLVQPFCGNAELNVLACGHWGQVQ